VEPWAQPGEIVHQGLEDPGGADADDPLRFGLVDGTDGGGGHLLRAYRERGAGGQAGLGEGPRADPCVLDGAENEAGGRHPGPPVIAVQHPAEGGKPVLAAAYASVCGKLVWPASEEMLTIRPYLRSSMPGRSSRASSSGLIRATCSTCWISAGGSTWKRVCGSVAALLTSTSTPPSSAGAASAT